MNILQGKTKMGKKIRDGQRTDIGLPRVLARV